MRLSKLQMQGFKSFADATTMTFDMGVTAIVGPNGCGKSNVSDAVRWVLGEQRARILRGSKMEEVIFQGSSARRAVNLAEVSLVFENEDGGLPVPFREVVITRRLSRSGESDYLLNGAPCRLRDIHDLLRGTGLGADSGIVIESKMIDALLSDRPDDRRELFEEAAGVGLYRDRRRSTERRLEETTVDLSRLDDLIGEVQSQVRSLARQRKRAERHVELTERRFSVDLTLASREMAAWHQELQELEEKLVTLREFAPGDDTRVRDAEQARNAAQEGRAAAEASRGELSRLALAQQNSVQSLRSEIAVAEERQRNALERRQRAEEERREGEAFGERLNADRVRAAEELATLDAGLATAREELSVHARDEDAARQAVTGARAAVEAADRTARELREQQRRVDLDRESAQRETADLEQRSAALEVERLQLADAAATLAREIEGADEAIELARVSVAAAVAALEEARTSARAARERDAAARAELGRAEDANTALEGKVNALEGLERERVGLAPAAARLLRDKERFGDGAVLGPISDFLSTTASSALLVERFLGMTVHAIVVRDRAAAEAVRAWHTSTNPGPLLLLPLDAMPETSVSDAGDLLPQVEVSPPAAGWVRNLLERVHSLDEGTGFVDARGAVWLPGTTAGPGPLRRRAELSGLRAELEAAAEGRKLAAAAAEEARRALAEGDATVAMATEAANLATAEDRRANDLRAELERRRLRGVRELENAEGLARRLAERQEELSARLSSLEVRAAELHETLSVHGNDAEALRVQLAEADHGLESARERRANGQVALAQSQARLQVATDRLTRLDQEQENASQRLASLHSELSTLADSDRSLAEQMAAWQMDLDARVATLNDAESRLADAEQQVRDADAELQATDHALDLARREAHEHESSLHQAQLRFTELSGRRATIKERLETEWRRPLEDLMTSFEAVDVDDDALRAEADELRTELEKLGPVNPLAVEEHEEEVKRLDFLTTQRNDLAEAKNKLQLAIREIDTTARELFLATFAQVRENFRQIFMTLFGGGECDLRLENPELPLDCDIEVHASPRGKRTQRIHLLSSGERALVALSLLFGIFLTKPSPFCLLDEVDAPLDDANIGRYVRMLTQFKSKTQFIVITHNPRTTTEAADAVYGVTMQEPGVSSLVSVRMRGNTVDDSTPDDGAAVASVDREGEVAAAPA
ncbi:MAG: chromosome segregation protein SMC [Gemmatimonadaceae bacterium]|nr:chromosome segregation protein SMC [Gemmatimonadaceae bacterium]